MSTVHIHIKLRSLLLMSGIWLVRYSPKWHLVWYGIDRLRILFHTLHTTLMLSSKPSYIPDMGVDRAQV